MEKKKHEGLKSLIPGALGGAAATAAVMPLDRIKDTAASWSSGTGGPNLVHTGKSLWRTAKELYKPVIRTDPHIHKGVRAFYSGGGGAMLKVVPAMAITYGVANAVSKRMEKKEMSKKADAILEKIAEYDSRWKAERALKKHFKHGDPDVSKQEWVDAALKTQGKLRKYLVPGMAAVGAVGGAALGDIARMDLGSHGMKSAPLVGAAIGGSLYAGIGALTKRHLNKLESRNPTYSSEQFGSQYDSTRSYLKGKYGPR